MHPPRRRRLVHLLSGLVISRLPPIIRGRPRLAALIIIATTLSCVVAGAYAASRGPSLDDAAVRGEVAGTELGDQIGRVDGAKGGRADGIRAGRNETYQPRFQIAYHAAYRAAYSKAYATGQSTQDANNGASATARGRANYRQSCAESYGSMEGGVCFGGIGDY